jgi:N-acetylmuramoyl-L-alanine amidase
MLKVWHCPGHGGDNPGLEYAGFVERHWVVGIARDIAAATAPWSVEHCLARDKDETIPYSVRGEAAHDWQADLVLCHHVNAMFDTKIDLETGEESIPLPKYDGLMTFVKPADTKGIAVAGAISRAAPRGLLQRKVKPFLANKWDWTSRAWTVVDAYTRWGTPAVLIEWGFATAPGDLAILQSSNHRPALVAAALSGIARMLEVHSGL